MKNQLENNGSYLGFTDNKTALQKAKIESCLVRYTSTEFKQVYFVTYENSIESNLLKMILVKDKLNLFMKDQDLTDDELYERFGVDSNMLQNLMYKEKTEEGYVIRWGNQKVS